ncbi:Sulfate adenylyltransferase subunit 1 [Serratia rubidaea]|uniref:Sulfate adenylyltransferase subunit 1 n=1 Tax=Serratia rubidaea TaxID=61652 RepID=A0A447QPH7_SERRU|nr:Sulfate adenylyltransferase subunit 1 [Serratia rubidaea]
MIIIDRLSNVTVGAGLIREAQQATVAAAGEFSAFELELNALVRKHFRTGVRATCSEAGKRGRA